MSSVPPSDDTELHRRETSLRLAFEGRVLESMSEGVSISDARGIILYTNRAEDRLFGYEPGELIGQHVSIRHTYPPDENRRVVADIVQQLHTRGVWQGEFSNVKKDGAPFTTLAHITALESDGQRYWVCVQQDITERKQAEEELRKRDERHRGFLDTSTEGIWRFELDAPVPTSWPVEQQIDAIFECAYLAECNDAMARMYGYTNCDELAGARLHQLLVRENPANRVFLREFITSGYRLSDYDTHERDRHGEPRVFRNSLVGTIEDGCVIRAWGTQIDVTAERLAQTRLRESEARYRQLAERESFLAEAGKVLSSSLDYRETMQRVADLAVPSLADWCAADMFTEGGEVERLAVAHKDPAMMERVLEAGRRWPPRTDGPVLSTIIRTRKALLVPEINAELIAASAHSPEHVAYLQALPLRAAIVAPLLARERVLGFLTLILADSDRTYTEEDLRLAEELAQRAATAIDNARLYEEAQTANRAKDDFLARLSHELRTPINAALGWTQLLRLGADAAQLDRGLTVIDRNTRALATIIEDLLEFSRNVRAELKIERGPIDLRDVVKKAVVAIEPLLAQKNVTLRLADGAPLACLGDAPRLQQVIWNLLTNAVKFTPPGGEISITYDSTPEHVELIVTDTGEGITAELLGTIFDPFRQGAVHVTGGLGLGLAIVRQIVDAHGGSIQAASEGPGLGATFTVRLPRG
jgi:PAS domain S-box-containing protein